MTDDDLNTDESGFPYAEPDRSNKEAAMVSLLFVGVVGMSMALVGLPCPSWGCPSRVAAAAFFWVSCARWLSGKLPVSSRTHVLCSGRTAQISPAAVG